MVFILIRQMANSDCDHHYWIGGECPE